MTMKKNFSYYFIPAFIAIYFIVALTPVIQKSYKEVFPFFSFRLYSRILENIKLYDLRFEEADGSVHFLLFNNKELSKLERKRYSLWLRTLGKKHEKSKALDFQEFQNLFEKHHKVSFVKLSGDNIEVLREHRYDIEIIENLK